MLAAESAGPPQGAADHGTAVVHYLSDRAAHRKRREPATAHEEPSPEQQLTEHMEALFNKHGRTLSDDDTAQDYRITLDGVLIMLDGALAEGVVGALEHQMLRVMVEGMQQAPQLL